MPYTLEALPICFTIVYVSSTTVSSILMLKDNNDLDLNICVQIAAAVAFISCVLASAGVILRNAAFVAPLVVTHWLRLAGLSFSLAAVLTAMRGGSVYPFTADPILTLLRVHAGQSAEEALAVSVCYLDMICNLCLMEMMNLPGYIVWFYGIRKQGVKRPYVVKV